MATRTYMRFVHLGAILTPRKLHKHSALVSVRSIPSNPDFVQRFIEMILKDSSGHRTFQTQRIMGYFRVKSRLSDFDANVDFPLLRSRLVKNGGDRLSAYGKRMPKCPMNLRFECRFLKLALGFQNWLSYCR